MVRRQQDPYWVGGGTERCAACTHSYAFQTEYRCIGCDRGVCAHCVVIDRATLEAFCPACHTAEGGS